MKDSAPPDPPVPVEPPVPLGPPGPAPRDPAGPRPLSERQHSHRQRVAAAAVEAVDPPAPNVTAAVPAGEPDRPRRAVVERRRPRGAKRLATPHPRRNRIRPNYSRLALRLSFALLGAVSLAALFFSPRLWVRSVRIEGLQTIPATRIAERLALRPRTNIVLLPAGRLEKAVEAEPSVARARVHRVPPDGVLVSVEEREPVAVVQAGSAFYTIDRALVPFRKGESAEAGLPLIVLGPAGNAAGSEQTNDIPLGKRMIAPGLANASKCLTWALVRADRFPLDRIVVDPSGGLCLNRKGGAQVRLGAGTDLDKKLSVLAVLLAQRSDVLRGDVFYVNLLAYDTPAILTREAAASAASTPPREP